MKYVKHLGNGWGKPTKQSKYHWFEGGHAICNHLPGDYPGLDCYVMSEDERHLRRCMHCIKRLPSGIDKESKQVERLQLVLREDMVLL